MLLDYQVTEISAYFLSLQNESVNQTAFPSQDYSECMREIARLETSFGEARGNRARVPLGTGAESTAARLHRQPTPSSVERAESEAEDNLEKTLTLARKLASDGKDADCLAALKKVALGVR